MTPTHDTESRELAGLRNIVEASTTGPLALRLAIAGRAYDSEPVSDEEFARQMRRAFTGHDHDLR